MEINLIINFRSSGRRMELYLSRIFS